MERAKKVQEYSLPQLLPILIVRGEIDENEGGDDVEEEEEIENDEDSEINEV